MRIRHFHSGVIFLLLSCLCALGLFVGIGNSNAVTAQANGPILISEELSTRAIVFDSATHQHEPFSAFAPISFGPDKLTRIMLFATNLKLQANEGTDVVSADAEDGSHRLYALTVEYVGPVPDQPWATSIVVCLNNQMGNLGDVLLQIKYRGVSSNRVRVGIGHVGDGPPDDASAVPTPGLALPQPSPAPKATAGTLAPDEVRTIIAQAVSVAGALNRNVTVAVVDREVNVLGVFRMTGASTTTMIRSVGAAGKGLEASIVPSELAAISKAGTGALFSTSGNAFSTRTAGFIIQEHFPPGVDFRAGGPPYGVQFSSLPCSDIKQSGLPLRLSGDPGGLPLYKNDQAVGGIVSEGQ